MAFTDPDPGEPAQPAVFLPHGGGPWPFMDDDGRHRSLASWLADLPSTLPRAPSAVAIVTAHWEVEHLAFGRALRPLRNENVVVIGSGLSTHDLSFRVGQADARAFDTWLTDSVALPAGPRDERLAAWSAAPGGRACHPREEHLLPLMVVAGAGGDGPGRRIYHADLFGLPAAGFAFD
jgi:aromatic ring-opening dioxygenase catalytic subunit (LigB family)